MTREDAIEIMRKNMPSDKSLPVYEAIQTLVPELAESEDERIRKWLLDYAIEMIAGLESDISLSTYDGIKEHDPEAEAELAQWQKARAYLEKQKEPENVSASTMIPFCWEVKRKEQKPEESISQLTVQGKGVYKICPRCKERMVRDDSMVYTSMPPQYRYECPKCGESECDTVMYDNPEMEEQKPAEWSEEDEDMRDKIISDLEWERRNTTVDKDIRLYDKEIAWLKFLRPQPKKELSIEKAIQWFDDTFYFLDNSSGRGRDCEITTHDFDSLEEMYDSFRKAVIVDSEPSWKPSEEQMMVLTDIAYGTYQSEYGPVLRELIEQLKKLL